MRSTNIASVALNSLFPMQKSKEVSHTPDPFAFLDLPWREREREGERNKRLRGHCRKIALRTRGAETDL